MNAFYVFTLCFLEGEDEFNVMSKLFVLTHRMFKKFLSIYLEIEDEYDRLLKK